MQVVRGKCSHCGSIESHVLEFRTLGLARNVYRCVCKERTIRCRLCTGMAKYSESWADEFCVDHWGADVLWKEGQLDCISKWPSLWVYQPKWWRRALWSLSPYRGDSIEGFSIYSLEDVTGNGPRVLYVNGFLSQSDEGFLDWGIAARSVFPQLPSYGVRWESVRTGTKGDIAKLIVFEGLAAYKTFGASTVRLWHFTALKAADTGRLLAQILMRAGGQKFILCGHSLGARVIFYALVELAKNGRSDVVRTAHLMGGAVGVGDTAAWEAALSVCSHGLANYYSRHDEVLRLLYIPAMGFRSDPIGRNALHLRGVRNFDVSSTVTRHTEYKEQFEKFVSYPLGL